VSVTLQSCKISSEQLGDNEIDNSQQNEQKKLTQKELKNAHNEQKQKQHLT